LCWSLLELASRGQLQRYGGEIMGSIGFLFPGQGSQTVGMGQDLYDQYPSVREIYERAHQLLGFDLASLCFHGPEEELRQTRNTQIAIMVHSTILDGLLKERGIRPSIVAGHSLGEYSANVSAGAMDFDDAVHIVRFRGELMQVAGEDRPGTMAAVMGLPLEVVQEVCTEASHVGIVVVANLNSPSQSVISGEVPAVERASQLARERGAKRTVMLNVSGAFHSPLMESAADKLGKALTKMEVRTPEIPVVANVTGELVTDDTAIRQALTEQILSCVLWEKSIRTMIAYGATTFVEVGPGKVLRGLVRNIDSDAVVLNAFDDASMTETVERLKEMGF
jgi:[acyl-carrier-protein] S-malonyltransferase